MPHVRLLAPVEGLGSAGGVVEVSEHRAALLCDEQNAERVDPAEIVTTQARQVPERR